MERVDAICDWLVAEGPHVADMGALLSGLAERLLAVEIPVARMATMIETLHPRFIGAMRVWEPDGDVKLRRLTFDDPAVVSAPKRFTIDELQETGDWVEFKLDDPRVADYDLLPRLAREGHTHYLLMPLRFREGPLQGMSFSTKQAGGFTAAQSRAIRTLQPSLALTANVIATHTMWREVLKAYVGEVPGDLILQGAIRRADVRRVEAALIMTDMRGFTRLANAGTPEATVAALNAYLDNVVPAIAAAGGEILKFIGDGVLATVPFRNAANAAAACAAALAAARAIRRADRNVGIALHVGEVAFGNIGAGDRLDFTIIGRDVNLLARIEKICGQFHEDIAMSQAFAALCGTPARLITRFVPKGFDSEEAVFAPA
jgi:adenylate cyclase